MRRSLRETAHRLVLPRRKFLLVGAGGLLAAPSIVRAGSMTLLGVGGKAAASAFQGPGDVVSGATAWASPARAYSAAFAAGGTAIMDLQDQAGANPITINILSTGFADVASINAWVTAHSVTTIKVTKLYDQTGSGNHFTNVTLSSMPALTMSALNGLPALTSLAANSTVLTSVNNFTQAQPFSMSGVYERTTAAAIGCVLGAATGTVFLGPGGSTGQSFVTAGTNITATGVTENAFHAIQGVFSSTIGANNTDGVDSGSTSAGAGTLSATTLRICRSSAPTSMTGMVMEAGYWPIGFNSTQRGNLNTNQHSATVGYNF